jgi:hypothetical protein
MPTRTVDDPKHWYDRAAEMRVLADEMKHEEAQRMTRKLADDYDKLGDRAAERQAHPKPQQVGLKEKGPRQEALSLTDTANRTTARTIARRCRAATLAAPTI